MHFNWEICLLSALRRPPASPTASVATDRPAIWQSIRDNHVSPNNESGNCDCGVLRPSLGRRVRGPISHTHTHKHTINTRSWRSPIIGGPNHRFVRPQPSCGASVRVKLFECPAGLAQSPGLRRLFYFWCVCFSFFRRHRTL